MRRRREPQPGRPQRQLCAAPGKPSAKRKTAKGLAAFLLLLVLALALLAGLLLTHRLPEAEAWLRGSFPGLNW
ncbi:MAG: hypothetical protein ACLR30_02520 [[Clostridium] leptum]